MNAPSTTDDPRQEIAPLIQKTSAWRAAPIDAVILLALLAAASWFLGKEDPGWQRANPTPWLLLPFFLGGRYGAAAGLVGALLAAAAVLVFQWALGNMTPQALFSAKPYFFLSFVIAAAVGTAVHRLVAGPSEQLRRQAAALADENQRLEEDVALYRSNEGKLQEALLLHGAETVSLTSEIQRLFATDRGRFDDALLDLFTREFGIIAAAIYRDDSGRHASLTRVALSGGSDHAFPESLPGAGAPLAEAAISSGQIATWESQWDGGIPQKENEENSPRPHLAAIPWRQSIASNPSPRALLLISRMEFGKIHWETFSRIEALFAWCLSRHEPIGLTGETTAPQTGAILPPDAFAAQIDLARRLESKHHLPGRLILFAVDPNGPVGRLEAFANELRSQIAPGLPIGAVGDGKSIPHSVGVIDSSPTSAAAELHAQQLIEKIPGASASVKHHVFSLEEGVRISRGPEHSNVQAHAAAPVTSTPTSAPEKSPDSNQPESENEPAPISSSAE